MKKKKIKNYLIEAGLIIFSVLVALVINSSYQSFQRSRQAAAARAAIEEELNHNEGVLTRMRSHHIEILNHIGRIDESDSLRKKLVAGGHLDISVLTNGHPIMNEILSNTAWETVRSTGIIAEFDYKEVEKLTRIYWLQEVLVGKNLDEVVQMMFQRETHDVSALAVTLFRLEMLFKEVVGQETTLINYYSEGKSTGSD